MYTFFYNNIFSCCIVQNTIYTPYKEIFTKLICKCHNIVWCTIYKFTKFLDSSRWNMTVPFHIVYRLSGNSMLNQIILWYSFFFHCLPKWRIIYHFYIHSFRFAQGTKRNENGLPERTFFFIILLIGNSVYYKSRGGEWAIQPAGWPYFYMCRLSFQAQISVHSEQVRITSTKSYLCLNNFVYGLDRQSMPFPPIIFVEPLWFWKESLWL